MAQAEAAEATTEPSEEDDPGGSAEDRRSHWSPSPTALSTSNTTLNNSIANTSDVILKKATNSKEADNDQRATITATAELGHDLNTPIALSDSDDEPLSKRYDNQQQERAKIQGPDRASDSPKQAMSERTGGDAEAFGKVKEPPAPPQDSRGESQPSRERTPTETGHRRGQPEDESQEATNEDTEEREILLGAAEREIRRHQRQVDLLTDLQNALRKQTDRTASINSDNCKLRAENRRQRDEIRDLKKQREPEEARKELDRKRILDLELESEGKQLQIHHLEKRVRRLRGGVEKWYERMKEEDTCD